MILYCTVQVRPSAGTSGMDGPHRCVQFRHVLGLLEPRRCFVWPLRGSGNDVTAVHVSPHWNRAVFNYQRRDQHGKWRDYSCSIDLDRTVCYFGGSRPWFLCPSPGCDRRVALLFGGDIFACRHCYDLAYASQRETPDARAIRRANKIRKRLRWVPGVVNGHGGKPIGMH